MMPTALKKQFYLHAQKAKHKQLVAKTLSVIQDMPATNPYISVSGGKDSSVILSLCRQIDADMPAVFYDVQANYPATEILLDTYQNLIRIKSVSRLEELAKDGVHLKTASNDSLIDEYKFDGFFYGIRADEAKGRFKSAQVRGYTFRKKQSQLWVCQPLIWWTSVDVWAYIVDQDLAYNALYDRMWDRPVHSQRIASYTNNRAGNYGSIAYMRMVHPELFNKVAKASSDFREMC